MIPRISDISTEGVFRASKWTQLRVFFTTQEMVRLTEELGEFCILNVSKPVDEEAAVISREMFLKAYEEYVNTFEHGVRDVFSSAWSTSLDEFYAMQTGDGRYLIKAIQPVIQLRAARFSYFALNHKITPMALGPKSVSWGIEFSYPHLVQCSKTGEISKVGDRPNTRLFQTIQRFIRHHSAPTTFEVDGKKIVSPIRLGKVAKKIIDRHPQLIREQMRVL